MKIYGFRGRIQIAFLPAKPKGMVPDDTVLLTEETHIVQGGPSGMQTLKIHQLVCVTNDT